MALSADRKLDERLNPPVTYGYPVQSGATVYRGSIVALCADFTIIPAGFATAGAAAGAIVGIAERMQSNLPVTPGAPVSSLNVPGLRVNCRKGSFALPFDAPPTPAAIGTPVYAVDDQTVSLSSNSNARLQVGVLEGFDELGRPWVKI